MRCWIEMHVEILSTYWIEYKNLIFRTSFMKGEGIINKFECYL